MRKYKVVSFELVEELAIRVRQLRFDLAGTIPSNEVAFPLKWFMDAYSTANYDGLFVVWDSGMDEMKGFTLYEACLRLC